jgi:hypothetical protein
MKETLYKKLNEKGMLTDEIPFFFSDLNMYFNQRKKYSLHDLNQNMENLGWGLQVIDQMLFTELLYYYENKK